MSNDNIRKVLGVDIKRWDEYLYDFLKSRKEIFL
jgi:hypothetical protein